MSLYQGILLGLVQGLTEFLPVSSTGHLVIAQRLIHFDGNPVAADALLHLGTLVAVVLYFRRELALVAGSVFKWATGRRRSRSCLGSRAPGPPSPPVSGAVLTAGKRPSSHFCCPCRSSRAPPASSWPKPKRRQSAPTFWWAR